MSTCVFVGPSLPANDVQACLPGCRALPPVQQGSIYEAVRRWSPSVIGIVDGYFQHRPSVWHKEILWALDQGVHVLGASSMGALRAAELAPFGMIGVGKVFETFLKGALPPFDGICDDDEVAIVHGPAESGYLAVSDALINIRFTIDAALAANVVDEATAEDILREAKSLHFSDRSYVKVIKRVRSLGVPSEPLSRLSAWLPTGKVDQKRDDAVAMLERIAALNQDGLSVHVPSFNFEMTEQFRDALINAPPGRRHETSERIHHDAVVDELRLNELAYREAKRVVLCKSVIVHGQISFQESTEFESLPSGGEPLQQITDRFRQANGLWDRESIDHWLSENDLGITELEALLRDEAKLNVTIDSCDTLEMVAGLIAHLKLNGSYPSLSARAQRKQDCLEPLQLQPVQTRSLLHWYFVKRVEKAVPKDIPAHARSLGLPDKAGLFNLLTREYHYLSQNPVDTNSVSGDGWDESSEAEQNNP